MSTITIAPRFRGPPDSGNGGYSCGLIASFLGDEAIVTLRRPPPLGVPLDVRALPHEVEVFDGATVIAEAVPADFDIDVPDAVAYEEAEKASQRPERHPFPACFVCGYEREPGDGLRIQPGAIPGREIVAAPWIPDKSLCGEDEEIRPEFVWAALDCPGGWVPDLLGEGSRSVAVLGRMEGRVDVAPDAGERCVVIGWPIGGDERKWQSGTALLNEKGILYAVARSTWIVPKAR